MLITSNSCHPGKSSDAFWEGLIHYLQNDNAGDPLLFTVTQPVPLYKANRIVFIAGESHKALLYHKIKDARHTQVSWACPVLSHPQPDI